MMSINQFRKQIYFNRPVELCTVLDRAMAERGATMDNFENFRFAKYYDIRSLIERLYSKLTNLSLCFLADPAEVNLSNILSNSIVCYHLPLLAQKSGRSFLVPVSRTWYNSPELSVSEYHWPRRSKAVATTQYSRPHLLPRLCGEYFLQAAEMLRHLRYYALGVRGDSIDIPAFAAGSSRSYIYLIRANNSFLENSTQFQFRQLWSDYLAPGCYGLKFFDETTTGEFPLAVLAGYVDLNDNLQFFTQ